MVSSNEKYAMDIWHIIHKIYLTGADVQATGNQKYLSKSGDVNWMVPPTGPNPPEWMSSSCRVKPDAHLHDTWLISQSSSASNFGCFVKWNQIRAECSTLPRQM